MDFPETGGQKDKDNHEASVAQQWWVDSHIQPMSEGLWGIRTQWHSVTFNLGGCQNALTLFFGASLAAGSDTATRVLIGWSNSGTGLSRCSCQTWLTAVAPEIAFNTVPLTSCMPSLTPHLMFFCSFTKKHLTELTDRSLSTNFALPNSGGGSLEFWHVLHGCVQIIRDHCSCLQTDLVWLVFSHWCDPLVH